jgi:hypothetical protein
MLTEAREQSRIESTTVTRDQVIKAINPFDASAGKADAPSRTARELDESR